MSTTTTHLVNGYIKVNGTNPDLVTAPTENVSKVLKVPDLDVRCSSLIDDPSTYD